MLTIFVPVVIYECPDCPHREPPYYAEGQTFIRDDPAYCRRTGDERRETPSNGIPDWCPLRTDEHPIDFGDTDDEDVARLVVACDRRLTGPR